MKKTFSIVLVAALMLPGLTEIGIIIDFKINRDFIAKFLCIERDEPVNTCEGQCYLSSQLNKAEEEREKQAPAQSKERLEIVYYYSAFLHFKPADSSSEMPGADLETDHYSYTFVSDIFHPPKET